MITYNNSAYLSEAINSILNQSFTEFEFIIVDDGSTDNTQSILQAYDDPRIRIITHENNQGRNVARNTALNAASGEYCAWMDSDDASLPFRLEKQVAFMDAHPDVILSGGHTQVYETKIIRKRHLADETIRAAMVWGPQFNNPSTIFRRAPCMQIGGFSLDFPVAEDPDFWRRLALLPDWRFANLDAILVRVRLHPHVDRNSYRTLLLERNTANMKAYLLDLGMPENTLDMDAHLVLSHRVTPGSVPLKRVQAWGERLIQFNDEARIFDPQLFSESYLQQLRGAYVKAPWLPVGLKKLIPARVKHWVKKGIFALKHRNAAKNAPNEHSY
jgi:glycosyltransferase involved in cell wall biosynthesis